VGRLELAGGGGAAGCRAAAVRCAAAPGPIPNWVKIGAPTPCPSCQPANRFVAIGKFIFGTFPFPVEA